MCHRRFKLTWLSIQLTSYEVSAEVWYLCNFKVNAAGRESEAEPGKELLSK